MTQCEQMISMQTRTLPSGDASPPAVAVPGGLAGGGAPCMASAGKEPSRRHLPPTTPAPLETPTLQPLSISRRSGTEPQGAWGAAAEPPTNQVARHGSAGCRSRGACGGGQRPLFGFRPEGIFRASVFLHHLHPCLPRRLHELRRRPPDPLAGPCRTGGILTAAATWAFLAGPGL